MNTNTIAGYFAAIALASLGITAATVWYVLTHPQRVIIRETTPTGPQSPIVKAKTA